MNFDYRIYYEDTDAQNVVYYANYLKLFERARTDYLREIGISQSDLAKKDGVLFVVKSCEVEYLKPAKLDDVVTISCQVSEVRTASTIFKQEALLDGEILSKASFVIVCVDSKNFRPTAIPEVMINKIN